MIRRIHEWLADNFDGVQYPKERRQPAMTPAANVGLRLLIGYLGLLMLLFCAAAFVIIACAGVAIFQSLLMS